MPQQRKMVNLNIEETSGVDRPAHLHEGWLVMKSANPEEVGTVLDALTATQEDVMPETTPGAEDQQMLADALEALAKAEERLADLEEGDDTAAPDAADATDADASDAGDATDTAEAAEDDIEKAAPAAVRKMLEDIRKERDAALTELRKERDAAADAAAVAKAREWSALSLDAEKVGPALRRVADLDPDLAKSLNDALSVANGQMESANMFAEIGKAASGTAGSAWGRVDALAKSSVEAGAATSYEAAVAKALADNPDLYLDYLNEKGA